MHYRTLIGFTATVALALTACSGGSGGEGASPNDTGEAGRSGNSVSSSSSARGGGSNGVRAVGGGGGVSSGAKGSGTHSESSMGGSATTSTSATGGSSSENVTGIVVAAGGTTSSTSVGTASESKTEFAPYFYTWAWGNQDYAFSGLTDLKTKSKTSSVTLAFVLSNSGCAVTTEIIDHLSEVDAYRAAGGHVKASFGGALGTYLENACSDASSMAKVIADFVTETGITDLDFDVEQAGAMTPTVNARRAEALKLVQAEKNVEIAYTLAGTPRDKWDTPGGLSASSLAVVKSTLDAGVKIKRINLTTMDYGSYYSAGKTMGDLAESVLTETATQLKTLAPTLSEGEVWHWLGATPMIGENDAEGEVFTLDDARSLIAFAKEKKIGLVSFWAINRDQACPYNDLGVCSKVNTKSFEFSDIFRAVE